MNKEKKNKALITFITTLSIIGLISGYLYYTFQPETLKISILNSFSIEEELLKRTNIFYTSLKQPILIFIYSISIIPLIINIFNIFYNPFKIGFIFNILKTYSYKLSTIYTTLYLLIPYIFQLLLIKTSITIIINIIKKIITPNKITKTKIKRLFFKYILLHLFYIIYSIIILIISQNINSYLMTFL